MKNKMNKVGRNDPCPCGSGLKYKKCCFGKEGSEPVSLKTLYAQKYQIRLKEKKDIEGIRKAGRLALDTLQLVEGTIRPGITTDDVNTIVHIFNYHIRVDCVLL